MAIDSVISKLKKWMQQTYAIFFGIYDKQILGNTRYMLSGTMQVRIETMKYTVLPKSLESSCITCHLIRRT